MLPAELPENESERIAVLQSYHILDTLPEPNFDQLVKLAATICDVPISLISLVDERRQWFKAKLGLEISETPRDLAFCAHALLQPEPLIIADATQHPRFQDHPLVQAEPHIRFYAGVPLQSPEGSSLGTFCVIDRKPRELTPFQLSSLHILANQAMQLLEQHRHAQHLSEQTALLEQMSRQALIGAWELHPDQGLTLSTEASRLFGLSLGPHPLQAVLDVYAPEDQAALKQALARTEASGREQTLELPFQPNPDQTRWSRWQLQARAGRPGQLWGLIQDVTRDKLAQTQAEHFQNFQAQLSHLAFKNELSQAELLAQSLDILRGHLKLRGAAVNRVFGDTIEVLAVRDQQPLGPDSTTRTPLAGSFTELVYQGQDVLSLANVIALAPAKAEIFESYGIRALLGAPLRLQGKAFGVVICYDPDPRHDLLTPKATESLQFFSQWLGLMLERCAYVEHLQKLSTGKDRLLAVIAHDLRNPLAAIQSAKWMLDSVMRNKQPLDARVLEIIDSSCKAGFNLIDELLEISDLEQQQLSLPLEQQNLEQILKDVLEVFEPLAAKKQIRLVWSGAPLSTNVSLNRQKFTRVLENLLTNALKFTPEAGEIRVRLEEAGREAWISIEDTGIGIAPEMLPALFDKFTQARRQGLAGERSMGLGMHIVKEIVNLHGGQIEVFSEVNQGTRFLIMLPLIRELTARAPITTQAESPPPQAVLTAEAAAYSILIVDDDKTYLRILAAVLSPLGYRVQTLRESSQVLAQLRQQPCDLILLDIQMPEISGIELCRVLKADPDLAAIPVIFITGNEAESVLIEAFEAGCADYVTKPFLRQELVARIQTQLSLRESERRLKKQLGLRELLLSQLAHDLRGPIGSTSAYLQWLLKADRSLDASRPMFEKLSQSLEKTYAMLESMLLWAQSVNAEMPFQPVWFDWQALAQESLGHYQLQAGQKQIELRADVSEPARLFADPNLIRVILVNLLGNALKYSHRGGTVSLRTVSRPEQVEIQVEDQGIGLSASTLAELEQQQLHVSQPGTEQEAGSGMGFRICQEFAARHGGHFKIVSEPGQGSCFSLFLPQPALQL